MHTGQSETDHGAGPPKTAGDYTFLVGRLTTAAASQRQERPLVSKVLDQIAAQVETAGSDLPVEMLDEHLFGLEAEMFHECWTAIPDHERRTIEMRVEKAVATTSATEEARRRSSRALRDREIRLLLDLPRLELVR